MVLEGVVMLYKGTCHLFIVVVGFGNWDVRGVGTLVEKGNLGDSRESEHFKNAQ